MSLYSSDSLWAFFESIKASIIEVSDVGLIILGLIISFSIIKPLVSHFLDFAFSGDSKPHVTGAYSEHRRNK